MRNLLALAAFLMICANILQAQAKPVVVQIKDKYLDKPALVQCIACTGASKKSSSANLAVCTAEAIHAKGLCDCGAKVGILVKVKSKATAKSHFKLQAETLTAFDEETAILLKEGKFVKGSQEEKDFLKSRATLRKKLKKNTIAEQKRHTKLCTEGSTTSDNYTQTFTPVNGFKLTLYMPPRELSGRSTFATAINEAGSITGMAFKELNPDKLDPNKNKIDLNDPVGSISNGSLNFGMEESEPVLWKSGGAPIRLCGKTCVKGAFPMDINSSNEIVGHHDPTVTNPEEIIHPSFYWSQQSGIRSIKLNNASITFNSIDDAGVVAGYANKVGEAAGPMTSNGTPLFDSLSQYKPINMQGLGKGEDKLFEINLLTPLSRVDTQKAASDWRRLVEGIGYEPNAPFPAIEGRSIDMVTVRGNKDGVVYGSYIYSLKLAARLFTTFSYQGVFRQAKGAQAEILRMNLTYPALQGPDDENGKGYFVQSIADDNNVLMYGGDLLSITNQPDKKPMTPILFKNGQYNVIADGWIAEADEFVVPIAINSSGVFVASSAPRSNLLANKSYIYVTGKFGNQRKLMLNDLIPPGSGLKSLDGFDINNQGVVVGGATMTSGKHLAFKLEPVG